MLIIASILIAVFQFIDGNIINPKLLSSSVEVHPLLVVCALLVGGAFGGVIGMVLSVPVAAVIKIQFERILRAVDRKRHGLSLFEPIPGFDDELEVDELYWGNESSDGKAPPDEKTPPDGDTSPDLDAPPDGDSDAPSAE
jgi:hypothetical protein